MAKEAKRTVAAMHKISVTSCSKRTISSAVQQVAAHRDVGAIDVHREDGVAGQRCDICDVLKEAAGVRQVVLLDQRLVDGEAVAPGHPCRASQLRACRTHLPASQESQGRLSVKIHSSRREVASTLMGLGTSILQIDLPIIFAPINTLLD